MRQGEPWFSRGESLDCRSTAPLYRRWVCRELLTRYYHPSIAIWRSVEITTVAEHLKREPPARPILDLGSGEGHVADLLFERIDVGVELASDLLQRARSVAVYDHLVAADAQRLPFRKNVFATVFSNSVIEHIPQNERVLSETARILRPGGRFIFTVPTNPTFGNNLLGTRLLAAVGLRRMASRYASVRNQRLQHLHTPTLPEWQSRLGRVHLDIDHSESYLSQRATSIWDLCAVVVLALRKLGLWEECERSVFGNTTCVDQYARILTRLLGPVLDEPTERGSSLLVVATKRAPKSPA